MSEIYYEVGGRRFLIAKDGYILPLRSGVYALDSPYCEKSHPNSTMLAMGIDTVSWRYSYLGGTAEKSESLLEALTGECREEGGPQYDPIPVHPRVITFFSRHTENFRDRANDETVPPQEAQVGQPFKLRNVIRTKSTKAPQQQKHREGERYPEMINPQYEYMDGNDARDRILRPSFRHAILVAEQLGMLARMPGRVPVELDYNQLALDWEAMKIHPAFIDFYCDVLPDYRRRWLKWKRDEIFEAHLQNLEFAQQGLHDILRSRLPNDAAIREMLHAAEAQSSLK